MWNSWSAVYAARNKVKIMLPPLFFRIYFSFLCQEKESPCIRNQEPYQAACVPEEVARQPPAGASICMQRFLYIFHALGFPVVQLRATPVKLPFQLLRSLLLSGPDDCLCTYKNRPSNTNFSC